MKKFFSRIILFALILFLAFSNFAFATNELPANTTNEDILTSYETDYEFINSDLFQADVDVEISDIVHGNSFVYGQNVTVTGEIYGDLFVIANSLNIAEDAVVYGNIFALATNITISGLTSDIYAMVASSFTLNDSGYIDRNINLTTDSVSLSGKIGRDVNLTCNNLSISESDEKIIGGDLSYTSSSEAQIPEEVIGGKITYTAPVEVDTTALLLSEIYNIISVLLYAFAFIMLTIWIAPMFRDKVCEIISKKGFISFAIGLLIFFGIIIVAILLLLFTSGFGAMIAVSTVGLLVLAFSVSNTVFSMAMGKLVANKFNKNGNVAYVLCSLLVVLILELISYIPYVGGPIRFITAMIGLGIIGLNAFKRKDLITSKES